MKTLEFNLIKVSTNVQPSVNEFAVGGFLGLKLGILLYRTRQKRVDEKDMIQVIWKLLL